MLIYSHHQATRFVEKCEMILAMCGYNSAMPRGVHATVAAPPESFYEYVHVTLMSLINSIQFNCNELVRVCLVCENGVCVVISGLSIYGLSMFCSCSQLCQSTKSKASDMLT